MNDLATAVVVIRRTFSAPREVVFRAWTEPEHLKRWFAPSDDYSTPVIEVDLRVGGRYRIGMLRPDGGACGPRSEGTASGAGVKYVSGIYQVIQPFDKLVFTWAWETIGMMADETRVTVEFFDQGRQTEVVLTHERLPNQEQRDRHAHGWNGCLDRLGKVLRQSHT